MFLFRHAMLCASAFALASGAIAQTPPAPADPSAVSRFRGHVEFLSTDLLEGRDTGSRGHEIAASYVAAEYRKLGLQPGGTNGSWYVQVPFRRASHAAVPTMRFTKGGKSTDWVSGRDFGLRPSLTEKTRSVDAGLVFVGHGISEPRLGIDEYAGLDVRGKIVVALEGAPAGIASDVAAHLKSTKDRTAADKGAVGFIEIGEEQPGAGRLGLMERRNRPLLEWVDAGGRAANAAVRVDAALSPDLARSLFDGAPKNLAELRAQSNKKPMRGFPLAGQVQVQASSSWEDFTSPEVVGVLPGADPLVAQEYVVIAGHLDHIGVRAGAPEGEDAINNGAIDNAGGIATMLEAARSFVLSQDRPRRSVMFIAHTGEEKGLLGAAYFAANPSVRHDQMVALVNLDMPLLLYPFTDVIAFGGEHSTIGGSVAQAASSMGVTLSPDPMPEQSLFVRSDHYPFVKQGIPSVFLMTGYANGGKAKWDDFLSHYYHKPNDDIAQAIDWQAGARFAQLNYRIARSLADAAAKPQWYEGSYFGDRFAASSPRAPR